MAAASLPFKTRCGFTLIELLVVISIIGILAALTLTGFNAARKNARDATRKSDLQQYRAALEAYASNNNGKYPSLQSGRSCNNVGIFNTNNDTEPNTSLLITEYLPAIIRDPLEKQPCSSGDPCEVDLSVGPSYKACSYKFRVDSGGIEYVLHTYLETGGIWEICSNGKAGKFSGNDGDDSTCDL